LQTKPAAGVIIAALVLIALMLPLGGGFTDDGYIHIQYARNIVERGEYSFNPGEVSFGTTSPLWVMIQAALGRFVGTGEALISTSRAVSWIAGLASVAGMFLLARALALGNVTALCCSLLLAAHAWFVRWTALGMETSLAVLAVIGLGIVSVAAFDSRRHAYLLGFFAAIAALLRPEAYLLVPAWLLAAALRGRRGHWGCVARSFLVFGLLVGSWLAFAKYHIGSFVPNTAGAKSGGFILDPVVFLRKFEPVAKIVGSTDGVAALLVAASVVVRRKKSAVFSGTRRFLFIWAVALPVAYVFFDIQVLSRYMLLTAPFTIVLGLGSLEELFGGAGDGAGRKTARARAAIVQALVVAAAVFANVVFYFRVVLPPSTAFSHDLTHNLKDLALFIKDHSEKDAVVAAADIGYLAFYSERRVLDLGGLVEDETFELREKHTYEEIVEKGLYLSLPKYPSVDYFIDRELTANRFAGMVINGYRFESVRVVEVRNLGIRKPGPYYYTLYRLDRRRDEET
jgi:hypothetical protein